MHNGENHLSVLNMKKHKVAVAITGASGSVYAKVLIDRLRKLGDQL